MSENHAGGRQSGQFAIVWTLILFAIFSNPPTAAGQAEFTLNIRGTVVDEAGMPVRNARVAAVTGSRPRVEAAAPSGDFTIPLHWIPSGGAVVAWNETGSLQGAHLFGTGAIKRNGDPIRIVLRKAQELRVTVTNPEHRPIAGAQVGATIGAIFGNGGVISEQATDDSGQVVLRFPVNVGLANVFAVKRDVGVNFNPISPGPPEPQTIVLGNNVTFQVRVTDDEEQPLPGVTLQPTSLSMGRASLSVQNVEQLRMTTDAAGLATFRTIPAGLTSRVFFNVERQGYTVIQRMIYDPRAAPQELQTTLAPLITLRGKVTGADGQPPGQTQVHAIGVSHREQQAGLTSRRGWGADSGSIGFQSTCDASGAFELSVARNHYYVLLASSEPRVARKESIVSFIQTLVVRSESPAQPLTFTLGPGTKIHGVATQSFNRTQSRPLSRQPVRVHWRDADSYAKLPEGERLPNPKGEPRQLAPGLVCDTSTDADGRFEFIAPPGRYALSALTGGSDVVVEVTDQAEIQADFLASGSAPGFVPVPIEQPAAAPLIELAGRVVLESDREHGIGNISVRRIDLGRALRLSPDSPRTTDTTSTEGTFKMTRPASEALLLASTSDGLLSGIVKIPATATEAVLPLAPSVTFRGRLIDSQTNKPLIGREIDTHIRTDQSSGTSLKAHAITDARGHFVLTGLAPGWPVEIQLVMDQAAVSRGGIAELGATRWTRIRTVALPQSGIEELGDVSAQVSEAPTLDQIIAIATRNNYVQSERLETQLGEAELLERQVLVFGAASASDVCRRFITQWYGLDPGQANQALTDVASQYVLLALDTTPTDRRARNVRLLLEQAKINLPAADNAAFSIVQPDGQVVSVTTSEKLTSAGQLDAEKLAEFLRKYAPSMPDAEKLLDDALAEAKRTGKRVFVYQFVPLSAPSALLSLFVDSQRDLLEKEYVCLKLDARYSKGEAAIRRAGGELVRHPWIGILDESGKLLTGRAPSDNAAASDLPGVARVEKMLRATARKLTEEEIQTVVKSLWIP